MRIRGIAAAVVFLCLAALPSLAQHDHSAQGQPTAKQPSASPAQQPPAQMDHSQHGTAPATTPVTPDPRPEFFRGKAYSEFSHHMAGVFVFLAGVFYLLSERIAQRWPGARYAWPVCLLLPGLYLIIFSDPKWPFGPVGFFELLQTNKEFMQHKMYATILICLGIFEFARTRGMIRGAWSAFVFPALALAGALMLLVHPHGAGEHSPEHLAAMQRIQGQHLMFTVVGAGIALCKGLSEIAWSASRIFLRAWPVLMMALGLMLIFYSE